MADNNQENIPPPPPVLARQVGGDLDVFPEVPPNFDTDIVPDEWGPLLTNHVPINGASEWTPRPNGFYGYTLEDFENIARNNGWYNDNDFEREELTDEEDDDDDDDEEEEVVDQAFHDVM